MSTGLVPYLQQIVPYLTSLNIPASSYFVYVFPTLDQNNCQLEEFTCRERMNEYDFNHIVQSNQAQSIQKLHIRGQVGNNFINHLSRFTALTELCITYLHDMNKGAVDPYFLLKNVG
jgi:hypothetical protein